MWYFKEAASSVWNATKGIIVDTRSPAQKLIDEITSSPDEIISTNKLAALSEMTYDYQKFGEIFDLTIKKIKVFQYDLEEARKNLNMLIAINYLIKHGATAFVDELREYINVFKKYQALQTVKTYEDEVTQAKMDYELEKIKSRAQHIQTLLSDKKKLLKQKELSMLVKQKLKLYEKNNLSDIKDKSTNDRNIPVKGQALPKSNQSSAEHRQKMSKVQSMLEKYLWKYVDKLDDKIQVISDKILQNVDRYLLGQEPNPGNFQLDDDDDGFDQVKQSPTKLKQSPEKLKEEPSNSQYQSLDDGQDDLMKRLDQELGDGPAVVNSNLLEFEEVEIGEKPKPKIEHQSLI